MSPHHAPGVVGHRVLRVCQDGAGVIRHRLRQVAPVPVGQAPVVVGRRKLVIQRQCAIEVGDGRLQLANPQRQLAPRRVVEFGG